MPSLKSLFLPLLAVTLLTSTCKKELIPGCHLGQPVAIGNGTAKTFTDFNVDGITTKMGFVITDAALESLSASVSHTSGNHPANVFEMQFPPYEVTGTPFKHCVINWNPVGHTEPVYNKPHLDMHFYTMGSNERNAIPDYTAAPAQFDNFPASDYLPADYFVPGGPGVGATAEPKMGTHWIDAKAPELQPGGEFIETFVYGSYDGKVNYYEPMMTHSFLKNVSTFSRTIPQPAKVQVSGYYPRRLTVSHSNGEYIIALEDFYYRIAG